MTQPLTAPNLDLPREELPATLLASIEFGLNEQAPQAQARLVLHRSLFFLHKIFKALASNRMQRGRLISQTVCQTVFATVWRLYQTLLAGEIGQLKAGGALSVRQGQASDIEIVRIAFKCLAKMMLYGFVDSSQNPVAKVSEPLLPSRPARRPTQAAACTR